MHFSVYPKVMSLLDNINPGESGLASFNKDDFNQKLRERQNSQSEINPPLQFLSLFIFENFDQLDKLIQEDPSLVASIEIKALRLLSKLYLNQEITGKDLFPFSSPELSMKRKIGKRVSREILKLYKTISANLSNFATKQSWQVIDFWKLSFVLPEMRFIYAQYLLEENNKETWGRIKKEIELIDPSSIANPEIKEEILLEKKYLEAFYYRSIGDLAQAEATSLEYFNIYKPDQNQSATVRAQGNQGFYAANKVLANWGKILEETDEVQKEVERKAGLYQMTCDYYKCSDCCSNTFPSMTFTEYQYLKDWMEKNNYPLETIIEDAKKIQADHKAKYGTELSIVDKEDPRFNHRGSENPHAYKFSCPFLKEQKCSIYQARPILCRGFGLSSDNDFALKTCKYYLAQYRHHSSPENERYSYDLRPVQMLAASSDRQQTGGKHLVGTLVAWLTRHCED